MQAVNNMSTPVAAENFSAYSGEGVFASQVYE
jgi:hypothetical protein